MNIEDNAQEHETQEWAIRNRPRAVERFAHGEPGYGPPACAECETEMHPVRRGYGFKICVTCASAAEAVTGRR